MKIENPKQESSLPLKTEAKILKVEKKENIFTEIQEEMFASTIEALLPKIKPFIKPAVGKFEEFLGDNEKTIIIRKLKGGSPTVFIFDNKIGNYKIEVDPSNSVSIFTASQEPSPVIDIYDVNLFIEMLISGQLMKNMKDKDK